MLPPITIFAAPRPFTGEFDRIQRNAIYSWTCLRPAPEVILFGDEAGVEEACCELRVSHIREIAISATGAPRLDDLFRRAQEFASGHLLVYVNPDVILLPFFVDAVAAVFRRFEEFLLVAAPLNAKIVDTLEGSASDWMLRITDAVRDASRPARGSGADLFMFPRGALDPIPDLVIGRLGWDNWLLSRCATHRLPAVDVTDAGALVHQDHSGSTHRGSVIETESRFQDEVQRNLAAIEPVDAVARRSEIRFGMGDEGWISRKRGVDRMPPKLRLRLRLARLRGAGLLRATRARRALDTAERWWKSRR